MPDGSKVLAAVAALADEVEAVHELANATASDVRVIAERQDEIVKSQALILQGLTKLILEAKEDRDRFFAYAGCSDFSDPGSFRRAS